MHREGNWYVAKCSEYGVVSQGRTREEAGANLREAVELYLEEFPHARRRQGELKAWLQRFWTRCTIGL